jgi:hypothetical protein
MRPAPPHGWKHPTFPAQRLEQAGSTKPHLVPGPIGAQSASLEQIGFGLVHSAKSQHRQLWSTISVQAPKPH